jgi:serine/threonine-protein kinase
MPISSESAALHGGEAPRSGEKKISSSKFELIAELGRGGMATVYLARAKSRPERLIVLKQLRSDLADNPEFLAMFLEEARLAGKLQHPNIVETYEVGQDGDTYYIAMEYLDGLSLQTVLTKFGWKGEFTFAMQVFVLIEALRGLEQAYTQIDDDGTPLRVVHRDVSPPNIIITFDGEVKLVDFGIAKAANSNVETRTGLIKGKLTYMAPEQAQSGDVDARTDIYSVGVMLWQAAAGQRRWKGVENTEVLRRLHVGHVVDSPHAEYLGLPARVNEIVLRAIAADQNDRYESATKMRTELEALLTEMESGEVGTKELRAFMSEEFAEARKRAAGVLQDRLSQLDATLNSQAEREPTDSVTAIRASVVGVDEKASTKASASHAEESRASSNRSRVRDKSTSVDATVAQPATRSHESKHTKRIWLIAVVGVSIAAGLGYLALHAHPRVRAEPMIAQTTEVPSPTEAPVAAARSQPTTGSSTPPSPSTPTEAVAAASAPSGPIAPTRSHHHDRSFGNSPLRDRRPEPAVDATPSPSAAPPVASAVATVPPNPDGAALDKADPWKQSPHRDDTDPWGGRNSQRPMPADPWAK